VTQYLVTRPLKSLMLSICLIYFSLPMIQAYKLYNVLSPKYHHVSFSSVLLVHNNVHIILTYMTLEITNIFCIPMCAIFFFTNMCVISLRINFFGEKYYSSGCMECEKANIFRANNIINAWINLLTQSNRNTRHKSQYYYIITRRTLRLLVVKSMCTFLRSFQSKNISVDIFRVYRILIKYL